MNGQYLPENIIKAVKIVARGLDRVGSTPIESNAQPVEAASEEKQ